MNKQNTKKPRSTRLRSVSDANRFLSRIINQYNRDEISSQKARDLGYLINVLIRSYIGVDLEQRIEALENEVEKKL